MIEEIQKTQQLQADTVKQIGKIIRLANQEKPIKLNLSKLVSKASLGYLLSGLKGNKHIYEINLNDCQLDDEDLERIVIKLNDENGINTVRIGKNHFENIKLLVELLLNKG